MPFESGAIHAPQHLQDLCVAYNPAEDGYVRSVFFPRKDVSHETDLIAQISKADTLRLYDLDVSGRGQVPEVTYRTAADITYKCKPIAAKAEINPRDMKNADAAYRHEKRQTRAALTSVGIRQEFLAINQTLRNASVLGATHHKDLVAATRWDSFGSNSADPIGDLLAACNKVRIETGTSPGGGKLKIAMHGYAWQTMQESDAVQKFLAYNFASTGARVITRKILAEVLDLAEDDIRVSSAQYTSTQQGVATPLFKGFLGSDVIIGKCDPDPENDQALGHEFVFDGLAGEDPYLVNKWREQGVGAYLYTDWVGVGCMADYKITNLDGVFVLKTVLDTTNTARYGTMLD